MKLKYRKIPFKKQHRVMIILMLVIIGLLSILLLAPNPIIQNSTKDSTYLKVGQPPDTGVDFMALRKRWKKMLSETSNPQVAYKTFFDENSKNGLNGQHLAAHIFGELLYEKYGNEGIAICDGSFSYGCYHGLAAQSISENGVEAAVELDEKCVNIRGEKKAFSCKHGIGHGLMDYYGHREDKLVEALRHCDTKYKEVGDDRFFGCYTGVIMEFNHPATVNDTVAKAVDRPLSLDNMNYPCTIIPKEYQGPCYHQMPQLWERYFNRDYKKVGEFCSKVKDYDNMIACYRGIGNIVGQYSGFEPKLSMKNCNSLDTLVGRTNCKIEVSWLLLSYAHSLSIAQDFCKDLPDKDKALCAK